MSTSQGFAQDTSAVPGHKFGDMSGGEKILFICKFIVFLCTFGFAFPTVLSD